MKIIKLLSLLLFALLFVQCDTAERRQSKAEDLIEKHLFETLDNFDSHELISIKLDTLQEAWLTSPEVVELGNEYVEAQANYQNINYKIDDLKNRAKSSRDAAIRSFFSGNGGGFWSQTINLHDIGEQILEMRKASKEAYIYMQTLGDSLIVNNHRLKADAELAGWYVTYKFRYKDSTGTPRIHTGYHILNPKLSEILYSWDENDYGKSHMIRLVNEAVQNELGEWRSELPKFEENENLEEDEELGE